MTNELERLADEAARLGAEEFKEFCRRLAEKRSRCGWSLDDSDEALREEDLTLSQHTLAEDWEGVPDDWEASECRLPEGT